MVLSNNRHQERMEVPNMTSPIFRIDAPSPEHLADFHRDGYAAFPDVLSDAGREGLIDEILQLDPVKEYLQTLDGATGEQNELKTYFVRPWNDRGLWSDQLIDAPLVTALLEATIGPDYHFCHSALNLAPRGAKPLRIHQDHHHWFHNNPINIAERDKWYIQMLNLLTFPFSTDTDYAVSLTIYLRWCKPQHC